MKLSQHFTVAEFTASDTAARKGIDNSLPAALLPNAQETAEMMEKIRSVLGGKPIIITSGYRSAVLNAAIGSSNASDHPKACAVDFRCPEFGTPYEVAKHLSTKIDSLGIGQLIAEFGQWIHVSTRMPGKVINRVITISARGTEPGIQRI
jgi:zinc D-Ala-D-Ala carboxypeptidase